MMDPMPRKRLGTSTRKKILSEDTIIANMDAVMRHIFAEHRRQYPPEYYKSLEASVLQALLAHGTHQNPSSTLESAEVPNAQHPPLPPVSDAELIRLRAAVTEKYQETSNLEAVEETSQQLDDDNWDSDSDTMQ